LVRRGVQGENYRKELIPVGLGLQLWAVMAGYTLLVSLWPLARWPLPYWEMGLGYSDRLEYALLLTIICFAGWLDDTVGNKQIKGLTGHLRALLKDGRWTTGLLKAGVTAAAAAWAVLHMPMRDNDYTAA